MADHITVAPLRDAQTIETEDPVLVTLLPETTETFSCLRWLAEQHLLTNSHQCPNCLPENDIRQNTSVSVLAEKINTAEAKLSEWGWWGSGGSMSADAVLLCTFLRLLVEGYNAIAQR